MTYFQVVRQRYGYVVHTVADYEDWFEAEDHAATLNIDYQTDEYVVIAKED